MNWQTCFEVIRIGAGFWAAFILVVIGFILTGEYDPARDDLVPVERLPWVWTWYGVQIAACIALVIWSTIRLRSYRTSPPARN